MIIGGNFFIMDNFFSIRKNDFKRGNKKSGEKKSLWTCLIDREQ